jgi:iron complex outermembrane receptor protein
MIPRTMRVARLDENLEVGIKSSFLDNRVRVNGAYFDYTYDNLQAQVFVEPPCSALGEYRFVADDVEGSGFELAVTGMVTDWLTIGANTGEVDAEYTQSQRQVSVDGQCEIRDQSGGDYANSPSNYSLFVNIDLPMESGAAVNFSFNYNFREGGSRTSCKYITEEGYIYSLVEDENGVLEVTRQSAVGPTLSASPIDSCSDSPDDEYATARARYTSASGHWELAVYAQNLLTQNSENDPGGLGGVLATAYWDGSPTYSNPRRPEFYGAELRYNFQ